LAAALPSMLSLRGDANMPGNNVRTEKITG